MNWQSLLTADRPARAEGRPWWDWALFVGVILVLAAESLLRPELEWRAFVTLVSVASASALLFRRIQPFVAFAFAFGALNGLSLVMWAQGHAVTSLGGQIFVLCLVFSVFRWGSGKECLATVPLLGLGYAGAIVTGETTGVENALGGLVALTLPMILGWGFRVSAQAQRQHVEQARLLEREHLAREMHDTVAHQMAAIAIQAQAAKAVLDGDREAARQAIGAIEASAKQTLRELREIVGALREPDDVELAPQHGIAQLLTLATGASKTGGPDVVVETRGTLEDVSPKIDAAVYRLAQESVTNARRHARHVGKIVVEVSGHSDHIQVRVTDDGMAPSTAPSEGFGLVGMRERTQLLGGTFAAGPAPSNGWVVTATLPRRAS